MKSIILNFHKKIIKLYYKVLHLILLLINNHYNFIPKLIIYKLKILTLKILVTRLSIINGSLKMLIKLILILLSILNHISIAIINLMSSNHHRKKCSLSHSIQTFLVSMSNKCHFIAILNQ
jgi:hypothetical protein